jgi:ABC-type proline/glycine betaine transport system permease subunit
MDNATFFTADRTTHVKIVVIALVASIAIGLVGIAARPRSAEPLFQATTAPSWACG